MPAGRSRTALAVAVALTLMAALAGCGDSGPTPTARAVVIDALAAFDAKDVDTLCDALSEDAQAVIGSSAHGRPPYDCEKDVRNYLEWMKPYDRPTEIVRTAETTANRAVAEVRLPDGEMVVLPLEREKGSWKLEGLYDAPISRVQIVGTPQEKRLKPIAVAPGEPTGEGAATVSNAANARRPRCPEVTSRRFPVISGGCVLTTDDEWLELSVRSPFGTMDLGMCEIWFRLRLDGKGRGWLDQFSIAGPNPCNDVVPCFDRNDHVIPWQARIEDAVAADPGSNRLSLDACLDTCVGRFEGDWKLDIVERPRGWRLRPTGGLAKTGWHFSGGPLRSEGKSIEISG